MLPQGIFLWNSGQDSSVSVELASLSRAHTLWAYDLQQCEPWELFEVNGGSAGTFFKSAKKIKSTIVVTSSCSTTMEVARNLAEGGVIGEWGAVVAVEQSSGRGQLRRPWVSPPGNLHASIVLPVPPIHGAWSGHLETLLPLVVGAVFGEVLDDLGAQLQIKWPNDLLHDGRKVGGMLIEERNGMVILGLGLNLAESPSDEMMREDYSVSAGKLKIPNHAGGPLSLLELLVNRGKNVYAILLDELVPSQFVLSVTKRLAWLGQNILVREGGQSSYEAKIIGLSPTGGLVLHRNGKETVLCSGSIFPL